MSKAKKYIVTRTVEYKDKDGKTQIIKSSKVPQAVPAALVKELLGKAVLIETDGTAAAADVNQGDPDGSEDENKGGAGGGAGGE